MDVLQSNGMTIILPYARTGYSYVVVAFFLWARARSFFFRSSAPISRLFYSFPPAIYPGSNTVFPFTWPYRPSAETDTAARERCTCLNSPLDPAASIGISRQSTVLVRSLCYFLPRPPPFSHPIFSSSPPVPAATDAGSGDRLSSGSSTRHGPCAPWRPDG
jgi:hypothetical protein